MATRTKNAEPETTPETTPDPAAELLALLAAAKIETAGLTKTKRTKGPAKIRTKFDTAAILAEAAKLPPTADFLDLLAALQIDNDGDDGPAIRTRLSQLCNGNGGTLAENFRPIAPAATPLYLATKRMNAIIAQLREMGIDPETATLDDAIAAQNAS